MEKKTAAHIVWYRHKLELRAEDIAEKMNIPLSVFMSWENGNTVPEKDQMKMLADILQISPEALTGEKNKI